MQLSALNSQFHPLFIWYWLIHPFGFTWPPECCFWYCRTQYPCRRLGMTGVVLSWLQSYLSGRNQSVHIGEQSSSNNCTSGISQGPPLGSLLFFCLDLLHLLVSPIPLVLTKANSRWHWERERERCWCFPALQQLRSLAPGCSRKITLCRQFKVIPMTTDDTELFVTLPPQIYLMTLKDFHLDCLLFINGSALLQRYDTYSPPPKNLKQ